MRSIVTVEQMRHIEQQADANGITYDLMMQRAGQMASVRIRALVEKLDEPRVVFLIGKGNNGGDGLVAAYELQNDSRIRVGLYLLEHRDNDPLMMPFNANGHDSFVAYFEDDHDNRVLKNMIASADLIVDAVFGIGIRLPIKGDAERLLRTVNQSLNARRSELRKEVGLVGYASPWEIPALPRPRVLAIDCPSGLDCDSGEIDTTAVSADETITFIAPKMGLLKYPGAESVGRLNLATLEIEDDFDLMKEAAWKLADAGSVAEMLPARPQSSNKGTFGKVMVVGGSTNYTGAVALSAMAAYRSGAGLVTLGAPGPVVNTLAGSLMEPTWLILPHDMGVISEQAVSLLLKEIKGYTALLIGPGMTQEDASKNMLNELFNRVQKSPTQTVRRSIGFITENAPEQDSHEQSQLPPLVIDADALNILSRQENWWKVLPPNTVITPHPGEMARLCGEETQFVIDNRWELVVEKSKEWNLTILLKGAYTLIASPDGRCAVLPFKTDALATAGTGDVLAGLLVGMRAQEMDAFESAVAAGYIHGLAGELAARELGTTRSVIAGDILNHIAQAFRWVERN